MSTQLEFDLSIPTLLAGYQARRYTPQTIIEALLLRIEESREDCIWIEVLSRAALTPYLAALAERDPASLPLYGIPFAIKDNIDLVGVPTTAACPAFAYVPQRSAFVVERLIAAGAIPLGKTNLDQFATGLVGTRSPYGETRNAFNPDYIAGGSSAGSAVAVARGLVSFALGTDTAGSGRVPAAFNNLIGLKPTRGILSARGVVPACRSLDCVSIFSLDAADAQRVLHVARAYDPEDVYSRSVQTGPRFRAAFEFGVPRVLETFDDSNTARLFNHAVKTLCDLGGAPRAIDLDPMLVAARLLYEGPWVAERYVAIKDFITERADALHPVTRAIIEPAVQRTAVEVFEAQYRLQALKRAADAELEGLDFIVTPTAGTLYRRIDVAAEPIQLNANLGYYTNFMNLLDYAAVAVPAGFGDNGLPYGVTLFSGAFADEALLAYAARLQHALALPLGATGRRSAQGPLLSASARTDRFNLVVCGAHLSGLPLNSQLTERGGSLIAATVTAPHYRLYALPGGLPARPGLVRVAAGGAAIEVEIWSLPIAAIGDFLAQIPPPLAIGSVELADGSREKGFLCEAYATGARDISSFGGWRRFIAEGDRAPRQ